MKEESNTKPIVSNPTEERLETIPVNDNHLLYNDSPNKEYSISTYSDLVEDHAKVQKIIPLKESKCKFTLYIILNICTLCIINLFIAWFPKMNLGLKYSKCSLKEATHLGIYGTDKVLIITELEKKKVPQFDFSNEDATGIVKGFNLNIDYQSISKTFLIFKYKLFDYLFNESTQTFESLKYNIKTTQDAFQSKFTVGLNNEEIAFMKDIFGECDIDIKIHSIFQIILNELTDPFYLFQLYSIILWYCNEYEYYSTVIVVLTIVSLIASVYETRTNLVQLHEMSKYSCDVNIYRKDPSGNLVPKKMSSTELVPGDLYEIPDDGLAMPCDTILVNGTVIINESMLTGESTPILKNHMPSIEGTEFDTSNPQSEKFMLFAGTKVVQKRALSNYKVLGVAYSTGFKTIKGNLIRGILFPKEIEEKFKKDSGKYIIFMSILCVIGFAISLKFLIDNAGLTTTDIVMKFLDLITTTVPPSLPACISVGITYALSRLKKQKIICIARERINIAGKVNIICFDKTGTLTEDHLDISGYVPVKVKQGQFQFGKFSNDSNEYSLSVFDHYKNKAINKNYHDKNKDIKQLYVECLACCHGITMVKGKLIGDPIDVKMFEGIGWELKENNNNTEEEEENKNKNSNENDVMIQPQNQEQKKNEQETNNYDPLISSYVRPKEEQDLNVKLSKLKENENEDDVIKSHYEIGIVRRFDFSSKLQRMTTIIKNINETYFKAFCKGSPEKIKELCKPATIPSNFNEILNSYTSKGFRVLAMATKSIKMNFTQSQQVSREFVESNMIFLGLLIVQNKLKKVTPETIEQLDNADIRMVMATGDNILTAISVCKECKLVQSKSIIYTCNIEKDDDGKDSLSWAKVDNFEDEKSPMNNNASINHNVQVEEGENILNLNTNNSNQKKEEEKEKEDGDSDNTSAFSDDYPAEEFNGNDVTIKTNNNLIENEGEEKKDEIITNNVNGSVSRDTVSLGINNDDIDLESNENYVIALTGPTFEKLYKLNMKYLEKKNPKLLVHHKTFRQILKNGIIFARMAPEHKALLVESFKQEQFTVLMCGDGANDCSALRSADVGVSLSPEEASIAAHFTSQVPDISCLLKLLREGKGSLATSIQTFKYMMLYSLIQFLAVTFLMIFLSYLSDFQFLASDLFIIFPLAYFIALTPPYEKLTHHYPISSLLSFPIIISIILQTVLCLVFQLGGKYVLQATHSWYEDDNCETEGDDVIACEDNSVLFLISHFQYLTAAITFSVSKPFRKPIYTNFWLMGYLILIFFYSIWITINCDDWSLDLFTLFEFSDENFKYYLFLVICINFVVSIFCEWVLMGFVRTCWENKTISDYKKKVEKYRVNPDNEEEYSICEYQRVFYHERRKEMEKKKKQD